MDFDYEEYEKECSEIKKSNRELLELFASDLGNLSEETIAKHVSNVNFYINEFLLYEDALTFDHGIEKIGDYLGDFFIRKCMWSTPATIKSTAASIKKFYKCMLDHGKIEVEQYRYFCAIIKSEMSQWQSYCAQFNNPDEENPFGFFW